MDQNHGSIPVPTDNGNVQRFSNEAAQVPVSMLSFSPFFSQLRLIRSLSIVTSFVPLRYLSCHFDTLFDPFSTEDSRNDGTSAHPASGDMSVPSCKCHTCGLRKLCSLYVPAPWYSADRAGLHGQLHVQPMQQRCNSCLSDRVPFDITSCCSTQEWFKRCGRRLV